ncbi:carboxypeptidase-like regulatory domain-containing protein [Emticicia sp. BO119]|uniref:carboxypeptidase-like regulatory domain-containing protein n=1 Tax=Emticicia sp. BO119 TaxID=2757768 RepID=UPI0015F014F8|nr:carboxypeptidase-like regulatory domain-containing protein [Emticicia sp. BO119]MBA4850622.1 carboxypeptidase-like regulatory domain-containing protein [Emticicia sp. BO119]
MKQSFQLNIENPCHEHWESFTPTSTGGFCASCQKNVIDFSNMPESQLVAFFKDRLKSSHNLCGRFREDQLKKNYVVEEWFPTWSIQNDQLQYEIPVAVIAQKKYKQAIRLPWIQHMKVVRNMAAAVLTLLCIEEGMGQNRVISGQVVDAEGKEGLPGVSIAIKGTTRGTVSDANGNYRIVASDNDILVFSSIGYETTEENATATNDLIKIEMKDSEIKLGEIAVVGYTPVRGKVSLGTGAICIRNDVEYLPTLKKFATKINIRGNAVQNGELILVPELVTSKDSTGNSFERANDEKWFRDNGFQEITSVQLYDYSGRIFQERFTKVSDGMISVDVRDIPIGTYIVRAVYKNERSLAENEISTVRILIER